ncbi:MAG: type VI secretion system membrane subunit TssM [Pseudomonadota bacterium]
MLKLVLKHLKKAPDKPWLTSMIAVLAFCLILWALAPRLGLPSSWLWPILWTALIGWAIYAIIDYMRTRKQSGELSESMAASADSAFQVQTQVDSLRQRFAAAIEELERDPDGDGKRTLMALPWYVVIGPSQHGKSVLLQNSGVHFPMERLGDAGPVQGTLNLKFWIGKEAIFVDTAGRYVSQDVNPEADQAEWQTFVDDVRKYRPKTPLNGILAVFSAETLSQQHLYDPTALERDARMLRQRIQELNASLGLDLPVYLLVSKCDLIAGFNEYFQDLSSDDMRGVVVGIECHGRTATGEFEVWLGNQLTNIIQTLRRRRLTRLRNEPDLEHRVEIQNFPERMAQLTQPLAKFSAIAFSTDNLDHALNLRGTYFTSATQAGRPVDSLLNAVSQRFGLSLAASSEFGGSGRSYFIRDLILNKIIPEQAMVGFSKKWHDLRFWSHWCIAGACGALLVGVLLSWTLGYLKNRDFIEEVKANLAVYPDHQDNRYTGSSLNPVLQRLAILRKAWLSARNSDVPWYGLFLNKHDDVTRAALTAYQQELENLLFPHLIARIEQILDGSDWQSYQNWRAFRAIMRFTPNPQDERLIKPYQLHFEDRQLQADFIDLVADAWGEDFKSDPGKVDSLRAHLEVYPTRPSRQHKSPRYTQLSGRYRNLIDEDYPPPSLAGGNRLMADIISNETVNYLRYADGNEPLPDIDFSRTIPHYNRVFAGTVVVPASLTKRGFDEYFASPLPGNSRADDFVQYLDMQAWILSRESWFERFRAGEFVPTSYIDELFATAYVERWSSVQDEVQFRTFNAEAADNISLLAGPQSPVINVLETVTANTRLETAQALGNGYADRIVTAFASVHQDLERKDEIRSLISPLVLYFNPGSTADESIRNNLVLGTGSFQSGPMRALLTQLTERADDFSNQRQVRQSLEDLEAKRDRAASAARDFYASEIKQLCEFVQGRKPLADASESADSGDVIELFKPGGLIEEWWRTYLREWTDATNSRKWVWREDDEHLPLNLDPSYLKLAQDAQVVRNGFFAPSGADVSVDLTVKVDRMTLPATQFLFSSGTAEPLRYSGGSVIPTRFTWQLGQRINFQVFNAAGNPIVQKTFEGTWALMDLLNHLRAHTGREPSRSGKLSVSYVESGLEVDFTLDLDRVNPLSAQARGLRCATN